jgi:hypothetical protein
MAALTNLAKDDILDLLFTNVAFPNVGDTAGLPPSVGAGTWNIELHTGNTIGATSTVQTEAVAAYTGYVSQTVARSVAGWTVASGLADNDAAITFPISTSGPETETDVSLGGNDAGGDVMQIFGTLLADLIVNNGITPEFAAGALDITAV